MEFRFQENDTALLDSRAYGYIYVAAAMAGAVRGIVGRGVGHIARGIRQQEVKERNRVLISLIVIFLVRRCGGWFRKEMKKV